MDTFQTKTKKQIMTNQTNGILFISQSFYTPDSVAYFVIPGSYKNLEDEAIIDLHEMGEFDNAWEVEPEEFRNIVACDRLIHYIYEA